jgi:hypothetical protein
MKSLNLFAHLAACSLACSSFAQSAATPVPTERSVASAVFSSENQIAFKPHPAFQLRDSFSLEFRVLVGWDVNDLPDLPEEEGEGKDLSGGRAVISCNVDEVNTRYAVYIANDLQSISFYNGKDWAQADYAFKKDTWYHVAVVVHKGRTAFVIEGEPLAIEDIGAGTTSRNCDLFIGSSGGNKEQFVGAIGPVRLWDIALGYNEINALAATPALPADPALARHVVAHSDFSESGRSMSIPAQTSSIWSGMRYRLESPSISGTEWHWNVAEAATKAKAEDKLLFVYCTRVGGHDPVCDAVEGIALSSAWWKTASERVVPVLQTIAPGEDASMLGIPAGYCALLTPDGAVLQVFQAWNEDQFEIVLSRCTQYVKQWRSGTSVEDRALALAFELSRRNAPNAESQLAALRTEVGRGGTGEAAADAIEVAAAAIAHAKTIDAIYALQAKFVTKRGEHFKYGVPTIADDKKGWVEDLYAMQDEALLLYQEAVMPIGQYESLAIFATLAAGAAARYDDSDLLTDVLEFAAPIGAMVPFTGLELRAFIPIADETPSRAATRAK